MKYQNFMCPYELALKLHELGVNSESEFYFVKEMKGGGSKTESVTQNTMRYSYRKEGDLIPAYMSHELAKTGYCWHCDTDSWVKEDGADVGI